MVTTQYSRATEARDKSSNPDLCWYLTTWEGETCPAPTSQWSTWLAMLHLDSTRKPVITLLEIVFIFNQLGTWPPLNHMPTSLHVDELKKPTHKPPIQTKKVNKLSPISRRFKQKKSIDCTATHKPAVQIKKVNRLFRLLTYRKYNLGTLKYILRSEDPTRVLKNSGSHLSPNKNQTKYIYILSKLLTETDMEPRE